MIEVNSVLFMGLWELVLLLVAADVVIITRFVIRRRREKASIDRLVALVKQDAEQREQETRKLLEKKYGYSDETLEKTTKKIVREEKRIYQTLANLFTTRDSVAMESLNINFEEAVEPYRTLDISKVVEAADAGGGVEDNGAEVERLKGLNQQLNEELKISMNTIGRMLHEYSSMSGEAGADKHDQDGVAEPLIEEQSLEDSSQVAIEENEVAVADDMVSSVEAVSQEMDEAAAVILDEKEAVEGPDIDSATLVGMFQEDDQDDEIAASPINMDATETPAGEENQSPEPELAEASEKNEPVEDILAQEIDEVLESHEAALTDVEAEEGGDEVTDPAEDLLAQAINETLESHETPLPDLKEEEIEDEGEAVLDSAEALLAQTMGETVESRETPPPELKEGETDSKEEVASDPAEALLAQAINETLESHETALPDFVEEEVVEEEDAEKQLSDEISETLNSHSEEMSDDDIDSLLQSAIADVQEK